VRAEFRTNDLIELGRRPQGIDAEELFRKLEQWNGRAEEIHVIPVDQALPLSAYLADER
jgi:hypothetical protein